MSDALTCAKSKRTHADAPFLGTTADDALPTYGYSPPLGDPGAAIDAAERAGLLLRDFSKAPATRDCLRITIGTPAENDILLAALESFGESGDG